MRAPHADMAGIKIEATGRYLPQTVVTNDMLSTVVDTNDEWITTRTGIHTRRFVSGDDNTLSMAAKAARDAIETGGIDKNRIGTVIVSTFTGDYATPSVACLLQRELGLPEDIAAFDISAACAGFVYALHLAHSLLLANPDQLILLVGSEVLSKATNFDDRGTCILFGDGAGAAVVSAKEDAPFRFVSGVTGSDEFVFCGGLKNSGTPFSNVTAPSPNPSIFMNGREVFKFAVDSMVKGIHALESDMPGAPDYYISHQANSRIIHSAAKKLGVPEEKFYTNIGRYGNTSSASIPIAMDEMHKAGLLKEGMRLILVGFGGGLTYGAAYFIW